jgi:hypothetical protein
VVARHRTGHLRRRPRRAAARGHTNGLDAFIDLFGGGYIELALKLGVQPQRINTIIDFAGAAPSLPR